MEGRKSIDKGAPRIQELPLEQLCRYGFVIGKASEVGFGNEMYKILTDAALSLCSCFSCGHLKLGPGSKPTGCWKLLPTFLSIQINLGVYVQDSKKEFSVLVDRSLGGSSIKDGQIELMLHRQHKIELLVSGSDSAIRKEEDVVTGMLAKGFILGKDAVNKAKTFDEKHQLTSTASAKVSSFDKKIGFTEKITAGTTVVSDKKVSSAGSAIMNTYVFTGASWVTGAFNKVAKAAGDVGQKTKEKVGEVEEERKRKVVDDFAQIHLSESPKAYAPSDQ
ncbi:hypothetical protein REPUB_Repub04eG0141900 [Reevesia pubescens]